MSDPTGPGGPVRVVVIDDPPRRNALDDLRRGRLLADLEAAGADPAVRAVVLTGAGGTFCAGGELRSMPTHDRAAVEARLGQLHAIVRLVATGPTPVVAAVEGFAYGSGLSLVAASDLVVAASDARLCAPFGRVGLAPDVGLGWTLPRKVGGGPARRLVLTGAEVDGAEAGRIGLADEVVAPGAALDRAVAVAAALARLSPPALAATRRLLSHGADLDAYLAAELAEQAALLAGPDFAEGRAAFLERRPPRFGRPDPATPEPAPYEPTTPTSAPEPRPEEVTP